MQTELFNQLESKIESMIDEVELLRMEISELREAKQKLEDGQQVWQENLQQLLNKFDSVDAAE
ncbi:MAG: cell division protein ZapB [Pseudomonadales bacterium]|jgi:cell division protein ZapB